MYAYACSAVTSYIIHHTSYIIQHTSYSIHHTSYIIHHTSCIIHHTSHIIHHTSYITHHTSYIIQPYFVLVRFCFVTFTIINNYNSSSAAALYASNNNNNKQTPSSLIITNSYAYIHNTHRPLGISLTSSAARPCVSGLLACNVVFHDKLSPAVSMILTIMTQLSIPQIQICECISNL